MRRLLTTSIAALAVACVTPVQSSVVATGAPLPARSPDAAPAVVVLAAGDPGRARELGAVEAHGRRPMATLRMLVEELKRRTAELGGDTVKVDSFATRYEFVTETYTYDCGSDRIVTRTETRSTTDGKGHTSFFTVTVPSTVHEYRACIGTQRVEAAILTLVGRALRSQEIPTP